MYCTGDNSTGICRRCGRKISPASRRLCVTEEDRARVLQKFNHGDRIVVPDINLGDKVEWLLSRFGINEDLVKRVTGARECGCKRRRSKMNIWSNEFAFRLQRTLNGAADFLFGEYISEQADRLARDITLREKNAPRPPLQDQ